MVEFTYQMVLSTLQTVGILVGIIYYITIMRNSQRNQELARRAQEQALETRQAQLFMDFYRTDESLARARAQEMSWEWNWENYDDFVKKYSQAGGNIENSAMLSSVFFHYEGLGVLAKRGLLSTEIVFELNGWRIINFWERFLPIIEEWRLRSANPRLYGHMEWLYDEMKSIQKSRGQEFRFEGLRRNSTPY